MLKWYNREIDTLYSWPNQPVGLQSWQICFLKSLSWTIAFEVRHRREEECQIRGREDCLIEADSGYCGGGFRAKVDVLREELIPFRSCRTEYDCDILAGLQLSK